MTTSPRPLSRNPSNPPPLDLGEASVPDDSHMPTTQPRDSEGGRTKKGVTFPAQEDRTSPPFASSPEGSGHRSSDEGPVTSDSGQPLNSSGPSKSRSSPRQGKSPGFIQSPRIPNGSPKPSSPKTMASPQIGRHSLREVSPPDGADV